MAKRMLIDATHAEETRVVVMEGRKLESFDAEYASQKPLKGNIYLARIERVEPSLQAAFVDFGEDRHGFLAFNEIHPDYFQIPVADKEELLALQKEAEALRENAAEEKDNKPNAEEEPAEEETEREEGDIVEADSDQEEGEPTEAQGDEDETTPENEKSEEQNQEPETIAEDDVDEETQIHRRIRQLLSKYRIQEVIRQRQVVLVQVIKEARGNKGAALTTYISLAGRYCVLMPNALRSGGVSRKITSLPDRRRLRDIVQQQELPPGMAMIIRTAGAQRTQAEITRDCSYLLQLWDSIRELTFQSIAPALIYEEASLIKRAIRDVYSNDIDEIIVDGEVGWKATKNFMRMLMPHHAGKIRIWRKRVPSLFSYYHVENSLDAMFSPHVPLRSGGYLVINQTEALVAVDVNSGKSTHQRNVEQTALRTNKEAAEEVARQMRLRDLAGLIVIDFIDMDNRRHRHTIENHLKASLRRDKARLQVGPISHFGLLEMSRQRLRPSVAETAFKPCPHCQGSGLTRTVDNAALYILREIESAAPRHRHTLMTVFAAPEIALFVLNYKRARLQQIESTYRVHLSFKPDPTVTTTDIRISYKRLHPSLFATRSQKEKSKKDVISEDQTTEEEFNGEALPSAEEDVTTEEKATTSRRPKRRQKRRSTRASSKRAAPSQTQQPPSETEATSQEITEEELGSDEPKRRRTKSKRTTTKRRPGRPRKRDKATNSSEPNDVAEPSEAFTPTPEVSTAPPSTPELEQPREPTATQEKEESAQAVAEEVTPEATPQEKPRRRRSTRKTREPRKRKASSKKTTSTKQTSSTSSEVESADTEKPKPAAKRTRKKAKSTVSEGSDHASSEQADAPMAPKTAETQPTETQQADEAKIVQPTSVDDIPRQKRRKTGWWAR